MVQTGGTNIQKHFVLGRSGRGSFLDRVIARVSPKKPIPRFIRHPAFRWAVFTALMGYDFSHRAEPDGLQSHRARLLANVRDNDRHRRLFRQGSALAVEKILIF
jgi:hypothetical protein